MWTTHRVIIITITHVTGLAIIRSTPRNHSNTPILVVAAKQRLLHLLIREWVAPKARDRVLHCSVIIICLVLSPKSHRLGKTGEKYTSNIQKRRPTVIVPGITIKAVVLDNRLRTLAVVFWCRVLQLVDTVLSHN